MNRIYVGSIATLSVLLFTILAACTPVAVSEVRVVETVEVVKEVVVTPTPFVATRFGEDIPARPDAPAAPPEENVVRFDLPADFWPDALSLGSWFTEWNTLTSAGLATETFDGSLRPELAERWEVSDDGLTYTFHLNPEAKFSDGSPITAEDVEFSLVTLLDPEGPADALYRSPFRPIQGYQAFIDGTADTISGIQVIDDHTIAISLTDPLVYFPSTLGFWQGRVVSKKNVTEGGSEWWRNPVTSGMYKVERFDYGQSNYIELTPNEYYVLGPKPKLQKIIIERVTDPGTRLTRYLNNETNVLYYPEPADVAAALRGGELQDELLGSVIPGMFFFYFRHDRPPFDDVKVRQAFIMAIDQDKLSRSVLEGTLFKLKSLIPRGTECDIGQDNQLPYDPAKARQLLAESKYADDFPLVRFQVSEILGAPTLGRWTRVATAMAAMWQEELNVSVQLQAAEFEFEDTQEGAAQVFRSSRSPMVLDGAALSQWFGQAQSTAEMMQYNNPEVQTLLAQADVEQDPVKRCEMYQQADKMLLEDGVFASAWGIANWAFAKPEVRGISTQTRWQFYLSIPQTYIAAE